MPQEEEPSGYMALSKNPAILAATSDNTPQEYELANQSRKANHNVTAGEDGFKEVGGTFTPVEDSRLSGGYHSKADLCAHVPSRGC